MQEEEEEGGRGVARQPRPQAAEGEQERWQALARKEKVETWQSMRFAVTTVRLLYAWHTGLSAKQFRSLRQKQNEAFLNALVWTRLDRSVEMPPERQGAFTGHHGLHRPSPIPQPVQQIARPTASDAQAEEASRQR